MPVDTLVNELIALGSLDETTVADLRRMQAEAAAGTLDVDDLTYIQALHGRLTGQPTAELADIAAGETRLDGLTIAEWRDRALAAETQVGALRDQLAANSP